MALLEQHFGRSYARIDSGYRAALKGNNIKEYDFFISYRSINNSHQIVFSNKGARPGKTIRPEDHIDIDFHVHAKASPVSRNKHRESRSYSYSGPAKYLLDDGEFYIQYERLVESDSLLEHITIEYQCGTGYNNIVLKTPRRNEASYRVPFEDATSWYTGRYYHDDEKGPRITLASHHGRAYLALNPAIPALSNSPQDLTKYIELYLEVPNSPVNNNTVAINRAADPIMYIHLKNGTEISKVIHKSLKSMFDDTFALYGKGSEATDFVYPAGMDNENIRRFLLGPNEFDNKLPLSTEEGTPINPLDIEYIRFYFRTYQGWDEINYHTTLYPQLQIPSWDEENYADIPLNKRRLIFSSYYIEPLKKEIDSNGYTLGKNTYLDQKSRYNLNSVVDNAYLTSVQNMPVKYDGLNWMKVGTADISPERTRIKNHSRVNHSKGYYFEVLGNDGAIVSAGNGNLGRVQPIRRTYDARGITGTPHSASIFIEESSYIYVTKGNKLYFISHLPVMTSNVVAFYAAFKGKPNILMRRVANPYFQAYETYEMVYPDGVTYNDVVSMLENQDNAIVFNLVIREDNELHRYYLNIRSSSQTVPGGKLFPPAAAGPGSTPVYKVGSDANRIKLQADHSVHTRRDRAENIQHVIVFHDDKINVYDYEQLSPVNDTFYLPKSEFTYDQSAKKHKLEGVLFERQTRDIITSLNGVFIRFSGDVVDPPPPFSINDIKQLTFIYDYRNRTGTAILNTTRPIKGTIRFNVNDVPKSKLAGFVESELNSGIVFSATANGETTFTMPLGHYHFKEPPNPYGIRYLPPSDRARISIKSTEQNNRYLIAYFHINERGEILLNIHGEWKLYSDDYLIARYQGGEYYHVDKVNKSYSSAYETYKVKVPGNISRSDAISLLNTDQLALFIAVESNNQINAYQLYPAVAQTASDTTLMNLAKTGAIAPHIRYDLISRRQVGASLYRSVHPDVAFNSSELSSLVLYTPSGIKIIPPSAVTGNRVNLDISDLHYDTSTGLHRLLYAIVWKDSHKIGGVDLFAGMTETGLDFSQFPATPFPDVRYIQIGNDKTTVGFGEHWYDRPTVKSDQIMGTLKYVAKNASQVNSTQTLDQRHPGTYHYTNNETSRNGYPAEGVDGIATFGFSWDGEYGLQDHIVRLYKDPHIPGLYSIRPNYDYTNICHHGHVANSAGSHWFALPGRLVETATLGTNIDYTDRRTALMGDASRLTVSDDFVGGYWEKGRLVLLNSVMTVNGTSKTGTAISAGVKSQLSNKPYNYYYGNSFLKNNTGFDQNPTNVNVSVDYGEEDKLPNINQDFTTNCGYNNSSRELSDWRISRVYYDHKKRLRFGQEDSNYSRVNYRGAIRNLTPGGITPAVGGIATLVNGGTLRAQSGTTSLFVNAPQCAVIEGDIIVDATGNNSEIPLELYKNDTLIVGVLIMRGRILIKGSNHANPLIGIKNPTLIINETHWDFDQLFAVIPRT